MRRARKLFAALHSCASGQHQQAYHLTSSSQFSAAQQSLRGIACAHTEWRSNSNSSGFAMLPVLAALPVIATCTANADDPQSTAQTSGGLIGLESKRRLFFIYEKRMRDKSSVEKRYNYFGTTDSDGSRYLTPLGLVAALTPIYPPSQSTMERTGSLDGEPAPMVSVDRSVLHKASEGVFKQFDVDGDGKISMAEFQLVLALLSIPQDDVVTIFNAVDLDGSGFIDAQEFKEVMTQLQGGPAQPDTQGSQASGLLISFFGPQQTGRLSLKQFVQFLSQLHTDIVKLEFLHYDVHGKGWVPGTDLARCLVASADVKVVGALLDKVQSMPAALHAAQVKQKDFEAIIGLARKSHSLRVALNFYDQVGRPISKPELEKMLLKLAQVKVSQQVLDIVMAVCGKDDGTLDVRTFNSLLRKREELWSRRGATAAKPTEGLARWWGCVKKCSTDSQ